VIVYGDTPELTAKFASWAGARLALILKEPLTAIGVMRGNEIIAAAIFNNYQPPNIEITFVSSTPRWATKGAIRAILGYAFTQAQCRRITAITEATNQPTRAFLCRLGFRQEGYHPEIFPVRAGFNGDGVSYGLRARDAARWLIEETHGRSRAA